MTRPMMLGKTHDRPRWLFALQMKKLKSIITKRPFWEEEAFPEQILF
jgi:hypothetical protein